VRAFGAQPPVNVKVLIEGEEETGSGHLGEFLERYGEMLAADVLILADSDNWKLGIPGLTTSIRGVVDCDVEVRTLDHAVHSGVFGGPVPDALTVLARVLATLHDDQGNVAVPGLATGPPPDLDLAEEDLRADSGLRPGVRLLGEGSITERLWMKPAVSILGIDAPSTQQSSNQLVPMARARVSLRVPPGQDSRKAQAALVAHLEKAAPWGATIKVEPGKGVGEPFAIRTQGPVFDAVRRSLSEAWGADVVEMGMGGSIPLVAEFARAFPEAAILLTGAADPDTRAHGENESVHFVELKRACLGQARLLSHLAAGPA
jgi:acetylornithine deacetylase/succinyl-diaminopimelate desuccinylase-like protein